MEPFVFFGGKGGVGKTTVSCAYAHRSATAGVETLVVSTDPAHSVSDVFDQPFDDDPRPVEGVDGLSAVEIDPDDAVDAHLDDVRGQLAEQVSPAMVTEIEAQLEMAHRTPGAYEAALFDRFVDAMRDPGPYERVVFDTAPTGATLRLLELPGFLEGWIDRLAEKRRRSVDLFEKAAVGDHGARATMAGDPILAQLRERKQFFEFAGGALRDDAAFLLVLNPDRLSVNETRRTVDALESSGLTIEGLVANKLTPAPDDDEAGRGARYLRDRIETERDRLAEVREAFSPPLVAEIESRPREIRGDLLVDVADELALDVDVADRTVVEG